MNPDYFEQESERLILRKLTVKDIEDWIPFFENNPGLPYLGIDLNHSKEVLASNWINKQLERYKENRSGHLAVIEKDNGQFIGMGGLLHRSLKGRSEWEIAYSLKPNFWGKGYATELAQQIKKFGFNSGWSNRFISIIDKANEASIRVAKKNGMEIFYETEFLGMDVYVYGVEKKGK